METQPSQNVAIGLQTTISPQTVFYPSNRPVVQVFNAQAAMIFVVHMLYTSGYHLLQVLQTPSKHYSH
jgi:hypothetical protein